MLESDGFVRSTGADAVRASWRELFFENRLYDQDFCPLPDALTQSGCIRDKLASAIGADACSGEASMNSTGVRAIIVILAAVLVLANLVALFGYPVLIVTAVTAAFAALVFIVALSAGDMIDKKTAGARHPEPPTALVARA
jgi:hypothetical protein